MAWPGVSRDTKIVSWLGATVCVSLWHSGAAIQRCDTICDTVGRACNMARNASGMGLVIMIQFCIATGGGGGGGGRGGDKAGGNLLHGAQVPRYDALRATKLRLAHGLGAMRAQPRSSVRAAWALGAHPVHPTQF